VFPISLLGKRCGRVRARIAAAFLEDRTQQISFVTPERQDKAACEYDSSGLLESPWTLGLGQRCLWLGQIADKATQINCDGSSRPASPITTICFPPTSFSPCITQCVLSFSYLFYPVAHNISLSPLFTIPVARTAPFCFMRF